MKALHLLLLLASGAVLAPAADTPSLSGKWQVHNSIEGDESDLSCTFTQKDNELIGSCNSSRSTGDLSGKVDEHKVTWTYKSQYNGGPVTLTYRGTLGSPTKIAGTVHVEEYGVEGEFTATQSK